MSGALDPSSSALDYCNITRIKSCQCTQTMETIEVEHSYQELPKTVIFSFYIVDLSTHSVVPSYLKTFL